MRRAWRIASVFAPPLLAGVVAFQSDAGLQAPIVGALVLLWWVMTASLVMRCSESKADAWEELDVLTGTGRALMWTGFGAILLATKTGWASLSVVGLLGLATACVAATWTAIVAGGEAPWRHATITRAIEPASGTEGDALREQVHVAGVRIPSGMRLFVQGRATLHAPITRYFLGSDASGAEVELASELGPAPRGEHRAPPLALWLGDVLGIAHSPIVHRGEATFSVVPRPPRVDGARRLLGEGKDDAHTVPTQRMPTEGTFRIREYTPGDDTRRIHWIRSLQTNQLVVRLPDEIPQAEPTVRLVLDSCLPGTEALTCVAHQELLDALVRVWLGIGNALAEAGTRVTLVTAAAKQDDTFAPVERALVTRSSRQSLQLGARVRWQSQVALASLLSKTGRQVVVTCRPRPALVNYDITYVVVPEMAWTTHGWTPIPQLAWLKLPYPTGSAENRLARRREDKARILKMWDDRSELSRLVGWIDWQQYAGSYVARPRDGRVALEVVS
jgi:uncharacterized protein (DUF58 family)